MKLSLSNSSLYPAFYCIRNTKHPSLTQAYEKHLQLERTHSFEKRERE